jgi:hypothetical protein
MVMGRARQTNQQPFFLTLIIVLQCVQLIFVANLMDRGNNASEACRSHLQNLISRNATFVSKAVSLTVKGPVVSISVITHATNRSGQEKNLTKKIKKKVH